MLPIDIPNISGIYRITCIITAKIYVGSAINLRKRRNAHFGQLRNRAHHNPKLQRAWDKYGEDAFIFEVLELVLIPEMLTAREQYWFDKLKPFGYRGFNIDHVAGSSLGTKRPPETGKRISAAKRGKPSSNRGRKKSPEEIEKHRLALTGYKHTEEAKNNMGKSHLGSKHSIESREKRRIALTGHQVSDETRAKIGEKSTGRVFSNEARVKMSIIGSTRQRSAKEYASRRRTLILTAPDGTEHVVNGIDAFCKEHGLDGSAIAKVARGKYAHHRGWRARFPETTSD